MQGKCSVCDANVVIKDGTQESEIISCPECQSRLVVASLKKGKVELEKAPEVEEDWGQ